MYKTKDIYLAATLMTFFPLINSERSPTLKNSILFQFADTPELREKLLSYTMRQLTVEPNHLFQNYKILKGIIHNVYAD